MSTKTKYVPFEERELTIRDLAKFANINSLKESYKYFYGLKKPKYLEETFEKIKSFKKVPQKDIKERIVIDIGGVRELVLDRDERDEFYAVSTNKFSLSFRPWKDVSNILISKDTLKHYTPEEIIAHFIWEITWYGNEEQMMKRGKELEEILKDIKGEFLNEKVTKAKKVIEKEVNKYGKTIKTKKGK